MQSYKLTRDAEQDLREVAEYTLNRWGKNLFIEYREGLKSTFESISSNSLQKRTFSNQFPDVFVTKYRYHYVFYFMNNPKQFIILGIIHEKRDLVSRLAERLS